MKLLIVDDSVLLRERLAGMIREIEGIEICGTAGNALEGLAMTKKLNPDLVTVDISMPGGGGIKLLKEIKDYKKEIIVIILTNYAYQEYKDKCFELGADYFFSKMKETNSMIESLKKLIGEEIDKQGMI